MIYLNGDAQQQFAAIERTVLDELHHSEAIYRTLTQSVQYVYGAGVQGDVAEFGTMTGRTAVALAIAVANQNLARNSASVELGEKSGSGTVWSTTT